MAGSKESALCPTARPAWAHHESMKLLAISGSLREGSLNTRLLRALDGLVGDVSVTIYDGVGNLPHLNVDFDTEDAPIAIQEFRKQLVEADAVVISSPEYAHGIPGSFKNALDWVVSSGEFVDKPVLLVNVASTGGERAQAQIVQVLKVMTANVVEAVGFTSAKVRNGIAEDGAFNDSELRAILESAVRNLAASA